MFEISKVYTIRLERYNDKKNLACVADLISFFGIESLPQTLPFFFQFLCNPMSENLFISKFINNIRSNNYIGSNIKG